MEDNQNIENKAIALVTGASRGIGKAIAIELARADFHVLINYKSNVVEAQQTLEIIQNEGGSGSLLPFDVSSKDSIRSAIENWKLNNPEKRIYCLVNNAGITRDNLMVFMEDAQWEDVINTNLHGFYYITRSLIQDMILNKGGRIINIISTSVKVPLHNLGVSNTIRGAVGNWSKTLANELASAGITVNNILPGATETERLSTIIQNKSNKMAIEQAIVKEEMLNEIPMGRFGKPEEVAYAAVFLA